MFANYNDGLLNAQKAAAQQEAGAHRSARRCKVASTQQVREKSGSGTREKSCSTWGKSCSTREKIGCTLEKFGTEGKIRSQVAQRAGAGRVEAGLVGWARWGRAGWGQAGQGSPGGGGMCVLIHKNVRRNRLECRFGAEQRGKNPVFFTGISPEGTGFSPSFPGFFSRKKSGEFEGKIRCYHNPPLLQRTPFCPLLRRN